MRRYGGRKRNTNRNNLTYGTYHNLPKALTHKSKTAPFPFIIAHECKERYIDQSGEAKYRTRTFVAFNDMNHFLKHRGIFPHAHEVMFNRFGDDTYAKLQGRLVFDFDFEEKLYDDVHFVHPGFENTIQELIILVFNKYYKDVDVTKFKFIWLISDTEKKWSKHLIVKEAFFCDDWKIQTQIFYNLLMSEARIYPSEEYPVLDYIDPRLGIQAKDLNMDNLIDTQVARNNGTMRMYGSSKMGGKALKIDKEFTFGEIEFSDTLIQQFNPKDIDVEQVIKNNQIRNDLLEAAYEDRINRDRYIIEACILANIDLSLGGTYDGQEEDIEEDDVTKCMTLFNEFWCKLFHENVQDTFSLSQVDGSILVLKRLKSHECPLSGRVHDSIGAFITIYKKNCYFHCYRKCRLEEKKSIFFGELS